MADMHDLALIRDSLVKGAIDLRACAEAMAEESQKSVARLREDVAVYQVRLDDAERLAGQDPLTGLDNRRRVESAIEHRIDSRRSVFGSAARSEWVQAVERHLRAPGGG